MPVRKTRFYENGYYHVYNRGVEKRQIFLDEHDYTTFTSILRAYVLPAQKPNLQGRAFRIKNHWLHEEIDLLAYCLMPNHFHLLLKQSTKDAITRLMRRLLTAYAMYFNEKYDRVGSLFQGRFKAKEIDTDEYLLHLSRYIHRNPVESNLIEIEGLQRYPWSSYSAYLGKTDNEFTNPKFILDYFKGRDSRDYQRFVEFEEESRGVLPKDLMLE